MEVRNQIKPILCLRVKMANSLTFPHFIKKRLKCVYSIEIERKESLATSFANFNLKSAKERLKTIGKNLKGLSSLDIKNYKTPLFISKKHTKELTKYFHNIISLSLPCCERSVPMYENNIIWITRCKRIEDLSCISGPPNYSSFKTDAIMKIFYYRLMKVIKRKKLKTLQISLFDKEVKVPYWWFPPTLTKLALFRLDQSISPLYFLNTFKFDLSLSHLKKLQTLHLFIPSNGITSYLNLLASVPYPLNITRLALNIPPSGEHSSQLKTLLGNFQKVEKLHIKMVSKYSPLSILEAFSNCPLQYLELLISLHEENQLISLGLFIEKLKNLKKLKIALFGTVSSSIPMAYSSLFEKIGKIFSIQTLEMNIVLDYLDMNEESFKGVVSDFSECIAKLNELQELSFGYNQGNFVSELESLVNVLKKKAHFLSKLEIGFNSSQQHSVNLIGFAMLLYEMKRLEELSLWKFEIGNYKNLCERFLNAICSLEKLKALRLLELNGMVTRKRFLDMIRSLLSKKGFEMFECNGLVTWRQQGQSFDIDIKDMIKRNPMLRSVKVSRALEYYIENLKILDI